MAHNNSKPQNRPSTPRHARFRDCFLALMLGALLVVGLGWTMGFQRASQRGQEKIQNSLSASTIDPVSFDGKSGPWGRLEYTPITIAPPPEFLDVELDLSPTRWSFPGFTRAEIDALFVETGLSNSERAILAGSNWTEQKNIWSVVVANDLLLGLSTQVRSKLYAVLAHFPQNLQANPLAYQRSILEARLAQSGLKPSTIKLCERLIYGTQTHAFLADDRILLANIADKDERLRLINTLVKADTYAVRLRVRPESNLAEMVQYWGGEGRAKDILPLLQSLQAVPGGYRLDLAHLIPGIPRRRIYTYPRPAGTGDEFKNCHWTSFNFHSDVVDDRFIDVAVAQKELQENYEQVDAPKFADVVLLVDKVSSAVVHSAVYLADDLVFTKNGVGRLQPWIYSHVRPMVDIYSAKLGKPDGVKALLFRRKASKN